MKLINPATEEVILELDEDTEDSLNKKFQRLKAAQPAWADLSLTRRVEIIRVYAALLKEKIEGLSKVLTDEVGKPLQQSRNEVNGAFSRIQWLADHTVKYSQQDRQHDRSRRAEWMPHGSLLAKWGAVIGPLLGGTA